MRSLQAMLEEQVCQVQENEVVRLRVVHMSPIPDTLYMVEDKASCGGAPCYPPYLPTAVSSTIDTSGTILGESRAVSFHTSEKFLWKETVSGCGWVGGWKEP